MLPQHFEPLIPGDRTGHNEYEDVVLVLAREEQVHKALWTAIPAPAHYDETRPES